MARNKRYPGQSTKASYVKGLTALNEAQRHYLDMLNESTVTFCTGPAGTGKTYLAAYVALTRLMAGEFSKVILTRPIVATEDIGYLPGDMLEKIHPYVLPLLDAIEEHLGQTKARELMGLGTIEIIPLAYMRGRSINNACIILDEAQNTTPAQMKMFLTRLGRDSAMAVTGDPRQSDLNIPENGLTWAVDRLVGSSSEISIIEFGSSNIVRNPLIGTMLARLEGPTPNKHDVERAGEPSRRRA